MQLTRKKKKKQINRRRSLRQIRACLPGSPFVVAAVVVDGLFACNKFWLVIRHGGLNFNCWQRGVPGPGINKVPGYPCVCVCVSEC